MINSIRFSRRKNLNRLPLIGVYRNSLGHPLNKTDHRPKSPKVHKGNEFLLNKGTRLQFLTRLGPTSIKTMNSNFALRETAEMPAQILESDNETQEKNEAENSARDREPMQALELAKDQENQERDAPAKDAPTGLKQSEEPPKYFSCGQCNQGFHTANEVESHLITTHRITDFRYHSFTPEGITPITGPDELSDPSTESPGANEQEPGNSDVQTPAAGSPETPNAIMETTDPESPTKVAAPGLAPEREAEDLATELQNDTKYPQLETAALTETPIANKETEIPETPHMVASPGQAPDGENGKLAPGSQNAANKETLNLETSLGVATLGSAPNREDEDQAQDAAIPVLRQENDNSAVQEEILTNKRAEEWARVEHLDHEINRIKAMVNKTQESASNLDKEPNKQDPQANTPPIPGATPRSAPEGEAVAHTIEKSDRNFLTFDETGDVVKGKWNSSPPKSEKYRKNQLLMGELRKDQDRIREKKKSKNIGHISAQEKDSQKPPTVGTSPGGATQRAATGGDHKSKTPKTRELSVVLSDINLRKNKNPQHTPTKPAGPKATERKNAEKAPPTAKPDKVETNTRSEPQSRKKTSDAKRVANQDLPKKQAKSHPPVKFIRADGVNDGDDEIQIIAQQNTRTSNHKPPGHIRAHKPQVTKYTNSTPTKLTRGHTKAPPNAPRGPTEKRKPRRPTDPQEVVVIDERDADHENIRAEKADKARENTRKHLTRMHRLRSKQFAYAQGKKKNKEKG